MSDVKLVIFDLDGVLVDACEWHKDALNNALEKVCNYKITEKDHKEVFNGIPTRTKLNILSERGIVDNKEHALINELKQEETINLINLNASIDMEKIELLEYILDKGFYLACYTNSIKKTATLMLEKTGILHKFHYILTNEDVLLPKPNPEGYKFLMEYFKTPTEKCYIVEDSPKGLKAAYDSGANVIPVKDPSEVNLKKIRKIL